MLRVSKGLQLALFSSFAISLVTGLLFYALKTWFVIDGEFGPERHPWQFPILKIHAASAFFMMLLYGAMLGSHAQFGWRTKHSRRSGFSLSVVIGIQILTAYLLYYLSSPLAREITEYVHLFIGILMPVALVLHISIARKWRAADVNRL